MRYAPLSEPAKHLSVVQTEDFEDLYDTAPCGYLSLAADGRIALANERIARWTGFAKSELTGKRIHDLLSVPSRIFYETNVSPLLRMQGFVDEVAMNFVTRDGVKLQCLVNAAERRDETGDLLFTRLTIFNATERRRYERSLIDAAKSKELGAEAERETSHLREQFIAVLGHDLRNPIASINSGIGLLADRERISEKGKAILNLMQGSVMRASDLIDNVLDFARGRLGGGITLTRNGDVPLTPVLEQVVAELALVSPGRHITAEFAIDEPVDCDRTRIAQLLSNLLGNALTHGATSDPIIVCGESSGDRLMISVANGGEPIDESAMEKLFQPFFRGDHRPNQLGLGLGLHIASEIAKAHSGQLTVKSDENETRFTFTMPLAPINGEV
jgi:sigma-B regulation protein RsbU (phosphoserine phosphatase)